MTAHARTRKSLFGNYRWIPMTIVGAFLVVVAANGGLVYYATKSWPGLASENAYNEGIAYNRVISEVEKENQLGWVLGIDYRPNGAGGQIVITANGSTGAPLDGLAVTGEMDRPLGAKLSVPLTFVSQGPGQFAATVSAPRPGQWDVYVSARRGNDTVSGGRRIVVPEK